MSTIVHVGIHKTGSTTLQNLLAKHRGALAAQGVHYPPIRAPNGRPPTGSPAG